MDSENLVVLVSGKPEIHETMQSLYIFFNLRCAKAMFGYMTDLDTVEECSSVVVNASGHDLQSALYDFMNEW